MSDSIERQAAIDAPKIFTKDCNPEHFVGHSNFIEYMDTVGIRSFGNWQYANGFNMGLTAAEVAIEKLPPAQQWIPVSSGNLPKVRQWVLCQCREGIQVVLRLIDNDGDAWECIYPPSTYMKSFVVAWMPLPEPYKRSENE